MLNCCLGTNENTLHAVPMNRAIPEDSYNERQLALAFVCAYLVEAYGKYEMCVQKS